MQSLRLKLRLLLSNAYRQHPVLLTVSMPVRAFASDDMHGKSPRHVDSTSRRLAANFLPFSGEKAIRDITAPQLVSMVRAIQDRGARDIAKRALERLGKFFALRWRTASLSATPRRTSVQQMFFGRPLKPTMRDRSERAPAPASANPDLPRPACHSYRH